MLQHLKSTSSSEGELNTFKNVIVKINNHLNKSQRQRKCPKQKKANVHMQIHQTKTILL